MSNHITEDQFAKCILGQPTFEERKHLVECAACGAELDRFRGTISVFRSAVHSGVDARIGAQPGLLIQPHRCATRPEMALGPGGGDGACVDDYPVRGDE